MVLVRRYGRCLWLLMLSGLVSAVEVSELRLVGLFKDTAVIQVRGEQHTLRVGETGLQDIRLLSTSSDSALLKVDGRRHQLRLTRAISPYVTTPRQSHRIAINGRGQYLTSGTMNGQPLRFLVDTGATAVALSSRQARRLGINFAKGDPTQVNTAGGVVKAYSISLDRIKVGGIEVRNVEAAILEGVYPGVALLGMSYLRHVRFSEVDGVLTLTPRY